MLRRHEDACIGYALASEALHRDVARALADLGGPTVEVSLTDVASGSVASLDLVICEIVVRDETFLDQLERVRARYPHLPILVYHRPGAEVLALATRATRLEGVFARERVAYFSEESAELRQTIDELLSETPAALLEQLVTPLLGDARPIVTTFAHAVIARLRKGRLGAPLVHEFGDLLRVSPRTLQRALREGRLPPPPRVLRWLTLLYVASGLPLPAERRQRG